MLDNQQRSRLEHLRQREQEQLLTESERAELEGLLREVEGAEAAYLVPATERVKDECEALEAQNRALEGLITRKQKLTDRLRDFLNEAQAERCVIDRELAAVLAGNNDSEADL